MSPEAEELLQKLKATIGQEEDFTAPEAMGPAAFRQYALAVQDPNPIYTDRSQARHHGFKDLVAPTTLICDSIQFLEGDMDEAGLPQNPSAECLPTPLRAGNDYEFFQPVYPDDKIILRRRVTEVWDREGRSGLLIFQKMENTYYNQHGQKLAINTELLFYRPGP